MISATTALNAGFAAPIDMALGGWKTERLMCRYAAVTDQTLAARRKRWRATRAARRDPSPHPGSRRFRLGQAEHGVDSCSSHRPEPPRIPSETTGHMGRIDSPSSSVVVTLPAQVAGGSSTEVEPGPR
jgi:hypothetical protein